MRGFDQVKRGCLAVIYALVMTASGAQAQFIADGVDVNTDAGQLRIIDDGEDDLAEDFSRILQVGDQRFFTDGIYRHVSIETQRGALYLIGLATGGNACDVIYVWLHTEDFVARLSGQFGNCAIKRNILSDAETVSVVMPAIVPADGFVAFVYDGEQISEVVVGQEATGVPRDAAQLVGLPSFEVFRDANWRAPLVALMGEAGYRHAGEVTAIASRFEVQDEWVAGSGYSKRLAGKADGAIAVHSADGRVIVAIRTDEGGLQVWGDLSGSVPDAISRVINAR